MTSEIKSEFKENKPKLLKKEATLDRWQREQNISREKQTGDERTSSPYNP